MIYLCLCPALLLRWLAVSSNNILRLQIQQTIPISLEKTSTFSGTSQKSETPTTLLQKA